MKNKITQCAVMILISILVLSQAQSVYAEIVKKADGSINYTETPCTEGLPPFMEELDADYDEFMAEHMSNPDLSSELLPKAVEKFNAYRDALQTEYFNYRAKSGAATAGQFELLGTCFVMINGHIEQRQNNLRQNFRNGAIDRKTIRLRSKYETINDRYKNLIHFPSGQILARMKSFADRLPCYVNKCQ